MTTKNETLGDVTGGTEVNKVVMDADLGKECGTVLDLTIDGETNLREFGKPAIQLLFVGILVY